jgi:hypothetical protein
MSVSGTAAWQLPVQWPRDPREVADGARAATVRMLKGGVLVALLALSIFDRFGLRLTDGYSVHPTLIAMYLVATLIVVSRAAQINTRGALAYLAVASVATLSFVVNAELGPTQYVSLGSFFLVIVLYAPLSLGLARDVVPSALWRWTVQTYIGFALFLAMAGIAQFGAQFVFRPEWLFDYRPLIPEPIRMAGIWNTVNHAGDWIKSNGFFLREASEFSFVMALAFLCELSLARRKWVMTILAAALVVTYSGSGLLALAVALLFPLGRRSLVQALSAAVVAVFLFMLLGDLLNLSYTVGRVDEFNSDKSSADSRFVHPAVVAFQEIDSHSWTVLLGHGPGTLEKMHNAFETTFAKAVFEYGLLGVLALGALVLGALNRSAAPMRIRVALAVHWVLLGGHLTNPEALLLIYLFSAMWPAGTAARAIEARRAGGSALV